MTDAGAASVPYWQQVPDGWPVMTTAAINSYTQTAATLLRNAVDRHDQSVAGTSSAPATVAHWWQHGEELAAEDLLLLGTCGLGLPPHAATSLLRPDSVTRSSIRRALRRVDDDVSVVMAGPATLEGMNDLFAVVDAGLSGAGLRRETRERAALLLCARLRPLLFPPSAHLTGDLVSGQRWQVYRAVLDDRGVRAGLDAFRGLVGPGPTDLALLEWAVGPAGS